MGVKAEWVKFGKKTELSISLPLSYFLLCTFSFLAPMVKLLELVFRLFFLINEGDIAANIKTYELGK